MEEALIAAARRARASSTVLDRLGVRDGAFVLVTVHRAENTDDETRLRGILETMRLDASGAGPAR